MIYYAQISSTGGIKIGYSDDVSVRLGQLEQHYGCPVALLATEPGDRDREAEVHGRFAHLRFGRKEQFRPTAELLESIGRPLLAAANPDAIALAPGRERRLGNAVRLDISDKDHERLKRVASAKGLNMAAYSRMAILERIRKDEEERAWAVERPGQ